MVFFEDAPFFQFTVTQVFLISMMILLGEVKKRNPKIPVVPKNQNWKILQLRPFTLARQYRRSQWIEIEIKLQKVTFLSEVQNLFAWKLFAGYVMVASLFSMLFNCVSLARGCVIVACDLPPWHTKNVFTFHFRSRVRVKQCAWNFHQSSLTPRKSTKTDN